MSKKVYTTSRVQQLIDLNEDLTNFKLRFNVTSKNGEEFDMAIADQYTIDNSPEEIVFKKVKNTISGTIVSDKNVFQNHFLILKSSGENPAEVEVLINKQEIPPNKQSENNERDEELRDNTRENRVNERVTDMRENTRENRVNERVTDMRENTRENRVNERVTDMRETRENMRQNERDSEREEMMRDEYYENYENEKTTWIDIRLIIIILICILGGIFVYNILSKKSGITTSLPTQTQLPSPPMNINLLNKLNSNIPLGR